MYPEYILKASYESIIKDGSIMKRTEDLHRFFIKEDTKRLMSV